MKWVLMLSNHLLLIQGVESLLCQGAQVEFIGCELNGERITAGIWNQHPDVLILEEGDLNEDAALAIIRFLGERLGIQIIGLGSERNLISVYHGEQHMTCGVPDLVGVIDGAASFGSQRECPAPST